MTVIAWDGRTLAADKRVSFQGLALTTTKIHLLPFGQTPEESVLVAMMGDGGSAEEMLHWLRRGAKAENFPERQKADDWASVVVFYPSGVIAKYERTPYPIFLEDERVAFGSGRDFAIAAMHCGKSAREAVEIACLYENSCGNGIDVLRFVTEQDP